MTLNLNFREPVKVKTIPFPTTINMKFLIGAPESMRCISDDRLSDPGNSGPQRRCSTEKMHEKLFLFLLKLFDLSCKGDTASHRYRPQTESCAVGTCLKTGPLPRREQGEASGQKQAKGRDVSVTRSCVLVKTPQTLPLPLFSLAVSTSLSVPRKHYFVVC